MVVRTRWSDLAQRSEGDFCAIDVATLFLATDLRSSANWRGRNAAWLESQASLLFFAPSSALDSLADITCLVLLDLNVFEHVRWKR
jgi:hypothetical protein